MAKVAIYIPAFNAAKTITTVLDRIPEKVKASVSEIFIIDNHSSDNTSMLAIEYAQKNNLRNLEVIRNPKNEGYGGSQKIAYARAIAKGYDCIAMLHGDAQYAPEFLENLIDPIVKAEVDLIFGSRMTGDPLKGGMPLHRYLGNRFLTTLQNLILGTRLSEFHSGYRVFSIPALEKVAFSSLSSDYHFDTEIIILFLHGKFRIKELPIPTFYGDEPNFVNVWKYGIDVMVTTITYWLHVKKIKKSKNWSRILNDE